MEVFENTDVNSVVGSFKESVAAVSPTQLLRNAVSVDNYGQLVFSNGFDSVKYLASTGEININILTFGKASMMMTDAFLDALYCKCPNAERVFKRGIILAPEGMRKSLATLHPSCLRTIATFEERGVLTVLEGAGGNVPDEAAVGNTTKALEFVRQIAPPVDAVTTSILVVLISGGGSSLLCQPRPPVTLADKQDVVRKLAHAGASIQELNCVRRLISSVKNGKLLQFVPAGVHVLALIVSDVVGDDLTTIASGPTYRTPNPSVHTAVHDPVQVVKKLALWPEKVPETVKTVLLSLLDESCTGACADCVNLIIGSNSVAVGAAQQAIQSTIPDAVTHVLTNGLVGDADDAGRLFAEMAVYFTADDSAAAHCDLTNLTKSSYWPAISNLRETQRKLCTAKHSRRPVCILAGGETTVIVKGTGRGGRNQQMVLQFAHFLNTSEYHKQKLGSSSCDVTFLSGGTDGQDGPTEAAGAVYSYPKYAMDRTEVQFAAECLLNNDSFTFWQRFRGGACHVKTGFTGTNVMDIQVLLAYTS